MNYSIITLEDLMDRYSSGSFRFINNMRDYPKEDYHKFEKKLSRIEDICNQLNQGIFSNSMSSSDIDSLAKEFKGAWKDLTEEYQDSGVWNNEEKAENLGFISGSVNCLKQFLINQQSAIDKSTHSSHDNQKLLSVVNKFLSDVDYTGIFVSSNYTLYECVKGKNRKRKIKKEVSGPKRIRIVASEKFSHTKLDLEDKPIKRKRDDIGESESTRKKKRKVVTKEGESKSQVIEKESQTKSSSKIESQKSHIGKAAENKTQVDSMKVDIEKEDLSAVIDRRIQTIIKNRAEKLSKTNFHKNYNYLSNNLEYFLKNKSKSNYNSELLFCKEEKAEKVLNRCDQCLKALRVEQEEDPYLYEIQNQMFKAADERLDKVSSSIYFNHSWLPQHIIPHKIHINGQKTEIKVCQPDYELIKQTYTLLVARHIAGLRAKFEAEGLQSARKHGNEHLKKDENFEISKFSDVEIYKYGNREVDLSYLIDKGVQDRLLSNSNEVLARKEIPIHESNISRLPSKPDALDQKESMQYLENSFKYYMQGLINERNDRDDKIYYYLQEVLLGEKQSERVDLEREKKVLEQANAYLDYILVDKKEDKFLHLIQQRLIKYFNKYIDNESEDLKFESPRKILKDKLFNDWYNLKISEKDSKVLQKTYMAAISRALALHRMRIIESTTPRISSWDSYDLYHNYTVNFSDDVQKIGVFNYFERNLIGDSDSKNIVVNEDEAQQFKDNFMQNDLKKILEKEREYERKRLEKKRLEALEAQDKDVNIQANPELVTGIEARNTKAEGVRENLFDIAEKEKEAELNVRSTEKQKKVQEAVEQRNEEYQGSLKTAFDEVTSQTNSKSLEEKAVQSIIEQASEDYTGSLKTTFDKLSAIEDESPKNPIYNDFGIKFEGPNLLRANIDKVRNTTLRLHLQTIGKLFIFFQQAQSDLIEYPRLYSTRSNYDRALSKLLVNIEIIKNAARYATPKDLHQANEFLLYLGSTKQSIFKEQRVDFSFTDALNYISTRAQDIESGRIQMENLDVIEALESIEIDHSKSAIEFFKIIHSSFANSEIFSEEEGSDIYEEILNLIPLSIRNECHEALDPFVKITVNMMDIGGYDSDAIGQKLNNSFTSLVNQAQLYDSKTISLIIQAYTTTLFSNDFETLAKDRNFLLESYSGIKKLIEIKERSKTNPINIEDEELIARKDWLTDRGRFTASASNRKPTINFNELKDETDIYKAGWTNDPNASNILLDEVRALGSLFLTMYKAHYGDPSSFPPIPDLIKGFKKQINEFSHKSHTYSIEEKMHLRNYLEVFSKYFAPLMSELQQDMNVDMEEGLSQLSLNLAIAPSEVALLDGSLSDKVFISNFNGVKKVVDSLYNYLKKTYDPHKQEVLLTDNQQENLKLFLKTNFEKKMYLATPEQAAQYFNYLFEGLKETSKLQHNSPLYIEIKEHLKESIKTYFTQNPNAQIFSSEMGQLIINLRSQWMDTIYSFEKEFLERNMGIWSQNEFLDEAQYLNQLVAQEYKLNHIDTHTLYEMLHLDCEALVRLRPLQDEIENRINEQGSSQSSMLGQFGKEIYQFALQVENELKQRGIKPEVFDYYPDDGFDIESSNDIYLKEVLGIDFENEIARMQVDEEGYKDAVDVALDKRDKIYNSVNESYENWQKQVAEDMQNIASNQLDGMDVDFESLPKIELDYASKYGDSSVSSIKQTPFAFVPAAEILAFQPLDVRIKPSGEDQLNIRRRSHILADAVSITHLAGGTDVPQLFYDVMQSSFDSVSPEVQEYLSGYEEAFLKAQEFVDKFTEIKRNSKIKSISEVESGAMLSKSKRGYHRDYANLNKKIKRLSKDVIKQIRADLKDNKPVILPSGIGGVHATYLLLEKEEDGSISASYINSGGGIEYHLQVENDFKTLYLPQLELILNDQWVSSLDFEMLITSTVSYLFNEKMDFLTQVKMPEVYHNFFINTKDYLEPSKLKRHYAADEFITDQRFGSCTWKCNESLIRTLIQKKFPDGYDDYKVIASNSKMEVLKDQFNETLSQMQEAIKEGTSIKTNNEFHQGIFLLKATIKKNSQKIAKLHSLSQSRGGIYDELVTKHLSDLMVMKSMTSKMELYRKQMLAAEYQEINEIQISKCKPKKGSEVVIPLKEDAILPFSSYTLQFETKELINSLPRQDVKNPAIFHETLTKIHANLKVLCKQTYFLEAKELVFDLVKKMPLELSGERLTSQEEYIDISMQYHGIMDCFFESVVNERYQTGVSPDSVYVLMKIGNLLHTLYRSASNAAFVGTSEDLLVGMEGIPFHLFSINPENQNYSGSFTSKDPQVRKEMKLLSDQNKGFFVNNNNTGVSRISTSGIFEDKNFGFSVWEKAINDWLIAHPSIRKELEKHQVGSNKSILQRFLSRGSLYKKTSPLFTSTLRWFTYTATFFTRLGYQLNNDLTDLAIIDPNIMHEKMTEYLTVHQIFNGRFGLDGFDTMVEQKNESLPDYLVQSQFRQDEALSFFEQNPIEDPVLGEAFISLIRSHATPNAINNLLKNRLYGFECPHEINTNAFFELIGSFENRIGLIQSFFSKNKTLLKNQDYQRIFEYLFLEDQCLEKCFKSDPSSLVKIDSFLDELIVSATKSGNIERLSFAIRMKNVLFKHQTENIANLISVVDQVLDKSVTLSDEDEEIARDLRREIGIDRYSFNKPEDRIHAINLLVNYCNPLSPSTIKLSGFSKEQLYSIGRMCLKNKDLIADRDPSDIKISLSDKLFVDYQNYLHTFQEKTILSHEQHESFLEAVIGIYDDVIEDPKFWSLEPNQDISKSRLHYIAYALFHLKKRSGFNISKTSEKGPISLKTLSPNIRRMLLSAERNLYMNLTTDRKSTKTIQKQFAHFLFECYKSSESAVPYSFSQVAQSVNSNASASYKQFKRVAHKGKGEPSTTLKATFTTSDSNGEDKEVNYTFECASLTVSSSEDPFSALPDEIKCNPVFLSFFYSEDANYTVIPVSGTKETFNLINTATEEKFQVSLGDFNSVYIDMQRDKVSYRYMTPSQLSPHTSSQYDRIWDQTPFMNNWIEKQCRGFYQITDDRGKSLPLGAEKRECILIDQTDFSEYRCFLNRTLKVIWEEDVKIWRANPSDPTEMEYKGELFFPHQQQFSFLERVEHPSYIHVIADENGSPIRIELPRFNLTLNIKVEGDQTVLVTSDGYKIKQDQLHLPIAPYSEYLLFENDQNQVKAFFPIRKKLSYDPLSIGVTNALKDQSQPGFSLGSTTSKSVEIYLDQAGNLNPDTPLKALFLAKVYLEQKQYHKASSLLSSKNIPVAIISESTIDILKAMATENPLNDNDQEAICLRLKAMHTALSLAEKKEAIDPGYKSNIKPDIKFIQDLENYFGLRTSMESFVLSEFEERELLNHIPRDIIKPNISKWKEFYSDIHEDPIALMSSDDLTSKVISFSNMKVAKELQELSIKLFNAIEKKPKVKAKELNLTNCSKEDLMQQIIHVDKLEDDDRTYFEQIIFSYFAKGNPKRYKDEIFLSILLYGACHQPKIRNYISDMRKDLDKNEACVLGQIIRPIPDERIYDNHLNELLGLALELCDQFTEWGGSNDIYNQPTKLSKHRDLTLKRTFEESQGLGKSAQEFETVHTSISIDSGEVPVSRYTDQELTDASDLMGHFIVTENPDLENQLASINRSEQLLQEAFDASMSVNDTDPIALKEYEDYKRGVIAEKNRLESLVNRQHYVSILTKNDCQYKSDTLRMNMEAIKAGQNAIHSRTMEIFSNRLSSMDSEILTNAAKIKNIDLKSLSSKTHLPSLLDLQQLYAQNRYQKNGFAQTLEDIYGLSENEIKEVESLLIKFSYFSRKMNSFLRVEERLKLLEEKQESLTVAELTNIREEIYTELDAVYNRKLETDDIEQDYSLVLIEQYCGFRIRPDQYNLIQQLLNPKNSRQVHQLIMGAGKTSVIALATLMVMAYNPANPHSLLMLPDSLKPQMAEFFRKMEGQIYGTAVESEDFGYTLEHQAMRLKSIESRISRRINSIQVVDKKSVLGFFLRVVNSMKSGFFKRTAISILKGLSSMQSIFDEIDSLMDSSKTMNMPSVDAKELTLSNKEVQVPSFFYQTLLNIQSDPNSSVKYSFTQGKEGNTVTQEVFNRDLKQELSSRFIRDLESLARNPEHTTHPLFGSVDSDHLSEWFDRIEGGNDPQFYDKIQLYLEQPSANYMMNEQEHKALVRDNRDFFTARLEEGLFESQFEDLFTKSPEALTDEELQTAISFLLRHEQGQEAGPLEKRVEELSKFSTVREMMRMSRKDLKQYLENIADPSQRLAEQFLMQFCCERAIREASRFIDSDDFLYRGQEQGSMDVDDGGAEIKDLLAIGRYQISELLPLTMTTQCYNSYGFSKDRSKLYAIPCEDGEPLEGSLFSSPYETLNFTYQLFIQDGVGADHLDTLIEKLAAIEESVVEVFQEQKGADSAIAINYFEPPFNHFYSLLEQILETESKSSEDPILGDSTVKTLNRLFSGSTAFRALSYNTDLKDVLLKAINNPIALENRLKFASLIASDQITYKDKELSLSASDLIRMIEDVSGFAGTQAPAVSDTLETHYDSRIDAQTMMTLSRESLGVIQETANTGLEEKLQAMLSLGINPSNKIASTTSIDSDVKGSLAIPYGDVAKAIIDVGGIFNGKDPIEVVKAAWKVQQHLIPEPSPPIKEIFYHNEDNVLMSFNGKVSRRADTVNVAKEQRITFYFQKNTVGVDIPQALDANAVITTGPDSNLNAYLQGALRMRGLGKGQNLALYTSYDAASLIQNKRKEGHEGYITAEEIVTFTVDNNVSNAKRLIDMHVIQEVKAVATQVVFKFVNSKALEDAVSDPEKEAKLSDEQREAINSLSEFMEKKIQGSLYDRLGHRRILKDSVTVLNDIINSLQTEIEVRFGSIPEDLFSEFIQEFKENHSPTKPDAQPGGGSITLLQARNNITDPKSLAEYLRLEMIYLLDKKVELGKINSTMYSTQDSFGQTTTQTQQQQQQQQQQMKQLSTQLVEQQQMEMEAKFLCKEKTEFGFFQHNTNDYFDKEYFNKMDYNPKNVEHLVAMRSFSNNKSPFKTAIESSTYPSINHMASLSSKVLFSNTLLSWNENLYIDSGLNWSKHFSDAHKSLGMCEIRLDTANSSDWNLRMIGVDEAETMKKQFSINPPAHKSKSIQVENLESLDLDEFSSNLEAIVPDQVNAILLEVINLKIMSGAKVPEKWFEKFLQVTGSETFHNEKHFNAYLNDLKSTWWKNNTGQDVIEAYYQALYKKISTR